MSYAAVALTYRDAGWAGVLPLPPRRKNSPPSGYTGYQGVDPTDDEIDNWVRVKVTNNIGIRMPVGIVGYDADLYKPEGRRTHDELVARCDPLPPTWVSTSRNDGSGISLYRVPPGTKLRTAFGGVEIIQHHHRYAVAWPSIHPEGREYRWITPDGEISDVPPRPDQLPWLPARWIEALREPDAVKGERPTKVTGEWSKRVRDAYGEAVAGLGSSRHDKACPATMRLARWEIEGDPGATEAIESFGRMFRDAVTDRSSGSEAVAEWNRIIDGARRIVAETPSTAGASRNSDRADAGGTPSAVDDRPQPKDVALWADAPSEEERPCIVTDLLLQGQIIAVAGEEGDGKTLLAQQLCHQIARGDTVLGVFPMGELRPRRILFVDTEMTEDDARPRGAELARRGLGIDPDRFFWVCTGLLDIGGSSDDRAYLNGLLDGYEADLVWIDAGASAVDDPNDAPTVRSFFAWLQGHIASGRLMAGGLTLHPRKRAQGEYGRRFDDLFGSREWKGKLSKAVFIDGERAVFWKDRGLHLRRRFPLREGERYPRAKLCRPGLEDPEAVPFVLEALPTEEEELTEDAALAAKVVELLQMEPDRYTKTQLAERTRASKTNTLRVVNRMIREGDVGPDKRGARLRVTGEKFLLREPSPDVEDDHCGQRLPLESSEGSGTQEGKSAGQKVLELTGTSGTHSGDVDDSESSQVPSPIGGEPEPEPNEPAAEPSRNHPPGGFEDEDYARPEDMTRCFGCGEIVDRRDHDTTVCGNGPRAA